jgi:hypothetical protein
MSSKSILRHVVMFGFKLETSKEQIAEIIHRFAKLRDTILEIKAFECGDNNSPEGLNNGLSHCFLLSFDSLDARDIYLTHQNHIDFSDWVGKWVETVTVLDYWANENP